jgi:hypothetical protein
MANALIVGLLGLAGLTLVRLERRHSQSAVRLVEAKRLAQAAVDLALHELDNDSNWRTNNRHDAAVPPRRCGGGTISWRILDPLDGDLSNAKDDPIRIEATGRVGTAAWVHGVDVKVSLETPLSHPLHVDDDLAIDDDAQLTASLAAVSTNEDLDVDGVLVGDAECELLEGRGTVTGRVTEDAPEKPKPNWMLYYAYQLGAMRLPFLGDIEGELLTPLHNTYSGTVHSSGLYFIDPSGALVIKGSRIHGTLIVDGDVICDDSIFMQNHRSDHPVLIVNGDLTLRYNSAGKELSESEWGVNFNPPGAAFDSETDGDQSDNFPNEIRGLIWVRDDLLMERTARTQGVILVDDEAEIRGMNHVLHDPSIASHPPHGFDFTKYHFEVQFGSWHRANRE